MELKKKIYNNTIPTRAPTIVAKRFTCSLVINPLFSNRAPKILSMKQPTVPEMIATVIAITGLDMIPNKYEAIPIIAAPKIPTAVPKVETAPFVPGSTFWKVVIKRGFWSNTPISEARVSDVAVAIAPMNPATNGR